MAEVSCVVRAGKLVGYGELLHLVMTVLEGGDLPHELGDLGEAVTGNCFILAGGQDQVKRANFLRAVANGVGNVSLAPGDGGGGLAGAGETQFEFGGDVGVDLVGGGRQSIVGVGQEGIDQHL